MSQVILEEQRCSKWHDYLNHESSIRVLHEMFHLLTNWPPLGFMYSFVRDTTRKV